MTTMTEASCVAGISAAELEVMQDAADAFRDRFGGREHEPVTLPDGSRHYGILAATGLFSALAEPFSPPPRGNRAQYAIIGNGGHQCD